MRASEQAEADECPYCVVMRNVLKRHMHEEEEEKMRDTLIENLASPLSFSAHGAEYTHTRT
jgi:hypothetical protein